MNSIELTGTPNGRYLKIETTLKITAGETSPILYDLTVSARAIEPKPPVGGYSFAIVGRTSANRLIPYITLIAVMAIGFAVIKRKRKTT